MNNLEQRLVKLENISERRMDLSGTRAAQKAQRERLIELSKIPEAVELVRELTELMIAGLPTETIEQKLNDLWSKHFNP